MTKKKNKNEKPKEQKPLVIMSATIKDELCKYSYEIRDGVGKGDTHKVDGSGLIKQDMIEAFDKFNVHLAAIDDVFKHKGIDIDNIDKFHNHAVTGDYQVTGFKMHALGDNEAIVLIGNKQVGVSHERMDLETPRIPLDTFSSYQWYNELKEAADKVRLEVELYKAGKCTIVEEEVKEDPKQLKLAEEMDMDAAKV